VPSSRAKDTVGQIDRGDSLRSRLQKLRESRQGEGRKKMAISGLPHAKPTTGDIRSVRVGDQERKFVVHYPSDMRNPRVLIAYHPALGSASFMEEATLLHNAAGAENFIVVYPEGFRRTWNVGECCGLAQKMGADDLSFFDAIMADLSTVVQIQPKAYVTGYSNGALMTYDLVCNRPNKVAAAVTFAAYLPPETIKRCPSGNVALMHLHGDSDQGAPVEGGMTNYLGFLGPARDTVETVALRNGCNTASPISVSAPDIDTTCVEFTGCAGNTVVRQCTIPDLGHSWPGMAAQSGAGSVKFGPARPELNGSQFVMEFFLSH